MHTIILLLALLPALPEDDGFRLELITDPWPNRPRVIGYEYNQKNHQDTPSFERRKGAEGLPQLKGGKRYQVVGVRIANDTAEKATLRFKSPQIRNDKRLTFEVPPGKMVTRFFAIPAPEEPKLQGTLADKRGREITRKEATIPPEASTTRNPSEAIGVARELEREDGARRRLAARPVSIRVTDDLDLPVPEAHLLLLLQNGMMVHEGDTDADGRWKGRILPGRYEVYAFAEVPDRTRRDDPTAVLQAPRLLVLRGFLEPTMASLELRPERVVEVNSRDAQGRSLEAQQVWITPEALSEAYRYELVASAVGPRARLASSRADNGSRFLLLTSPEMAANVALLAEPDAGLSVFLRGRCDPAAERLDLTFDPKALGRVILDPGTGAGPGRKARVDLVAVGQGLREKIQAETEHLHTFYLAPGVYRTALDYALNGGATSFIPYRIEAAPGATVDITPRPPFEVTAYYKRKDKTMQLWLAVKDAFGRVLARVPGKGGEVIGRRPDGRPDVRPLERFRWEVSSGAARVELENLVSAVKVPFGDDLLQLSARHEVLNVYNVEGASGMAPASLAQNILALLPQVARAVQGSLKYLGLPEGGRHIHMDFDIFMPPGVGGTGGGGRINLAIPTLFPITDGTDLLPGAFRHELGHNLGFGHDPYMLLAPEGVDEERFGPFGYRMLHARDFQRTLRYLEGTRREDRGTWNPGDGVFAGLRLLYGPEVHKKMITERRASSQTLVLYGLSSIERIATLYSLALDENVAWIFRAHGWPVFDHRVDLGGAAVRIKKRHPRQLNYARVDGSPLSSWWVYGPVQSGEEETKWRRVAWPTGFTGVDEDRPPPDGKKSYLYFRRIVVPKDLEAQILCASDVQLELRVNGTPLGYLDASPQYSQPVHDELMLNQKRPFTVQLYRGENIIEVAVNQPPGSKGFVLEVITPDGKPLPLRYADEGPPGEDLSRKLVKLKKGNVIHNASFEVGGSRPRGWVPGANEGALSLALDREQRLSGQQSLRFDAGGPCRGGLIQRVVVEPDKRYELSVNIKTEGLAGKTYVSFFTGDIHAEQGKTAPVLKPTTPWTRFQSKWFSGSGRVVYIACYVDATAGKVWFDDLQLVETK